MHDFGKPIVKKTVEGGRDIFYKHPEVSAQMAKDILKRLRFDNYTIDHVVRLVKWHGLKYYADPVDLRKALNRVGKDLFEAFLKVQEADIKAKSPAVIDKKLKLLQEKKEIYQQVILAGDCFEISALAVSGKDLIMAGIKPGPLLGAILERLVDYVIEDPTLNQKEILLKHAMEIKDDPSVFDERPAFFAK